MKRLTLFFLALCILPVESAIRADDLSIFNFTLKERLVERNIVDIFAKGQANYSCPSAGSCRYLHREMVTQCRLSDEYHRGGGQDLGNFDNAHHLEPGGGITRSINSRDFSLACPTFQLGNSVDKPGIPDPNATHFDCIEDEQGNEPPRGFKYSGFQKVIIANLGGGGVDASCVLVAKDVSSCDNKFFNLHVEVTGLTGEQTIIVDLEVTRDDGSILEEPRAQLSAEEPTHDYEGERFKTGWQYNLILLSEPTIGSCRVEGAEGTFESEDAMVRVECGQDIRLGTRVRGLRDGQQVVADLYRINAPNTAIDSLIFNSNNTQYFFEKGISGDRYRVRHSSTARCIVIPDGFQTVRSDGPAFLPTIECTCDPEFEDCECDPEFENCPCDPEFEDCSEDSHQMSVAMDLDTFDGLPGTGAVVVQMNIYSESGVLEGNERTTVSSDNPIQHIGEPVEEGKKVRFVVHQSGLGLDCGLSPQGQFTVLGPVEAEVSCTAGPAYWCEILRNCDDDCSYGIATEGPVAIGTRGPGEGQYTPTPIDLFRLFDDCRGGEPQIATGNLPEASFFQSTSAATNATPQELGPWVYFRNREGTTWSGVIDVIGVARDDEDGISTVRIYVDGNPATISNLQVNQIDSLTCSELPGGNCDTSSSFTGRLDTSEYSDGIHTVSVTAFNAAGTPGIASVGLTFDNEDGQGGGGGTPPAVPTGVAATDGTFDDRVRVRWNSATGAETYEVWRREPAGTGPASRIASSIAGLSYDDFGVEIGTVYEYAIRAVNTHGTTALSSYNSGSAQSSTTNDGTPDGFLEVASCTDISGWARDPDSVTAIQVHLYRDGPFANGGTIVATLQANRSRADLPFPDKNHGFTWSVPSGSIPHGTPIYAYALGVDSSGSSDGGLFQLSWSPRTLVCEGASPPEAPTGVTASDGTFTDRVQVNWHASTGASSYEVWRRLGGSTDSPSRVAASVFGQLHHDFSANADTGYEYWVKAVGNGGTSGFSSPDQGYAQSAATNTAPPTGTLEEASCTRIRGWTRDADYTGRIQVHLYRDGPFANGGTILTTMWADVHRPDLPFADTHHGFVYTVTAGSLPHGTPIYAYGIGVDSAGTINGEVVRLTSAPLSFNCP